MLFEQLDLLLMIFFLSIYVAQRKNKTFGLPKLCRIYP